MATQDNVTIQSSKNGNTPLSDAELLQLFYACWCPELARTQRRLRASDGHLSVIQKRQHEGKH